MDITEQEARTLRELLTYPEIGLPDYGNDSHAQRRAGAIICGNYPGRYY
jgi:hypothetical protein